ncbi:MAG: Spermidine/putrescine-binding periplasmic protein PotD [candidate division TM6 bacterium GW2011_GWF2_28_16]|nr:MAG: Spermidine/putrescine-binding periplasmic protein PotD [candidate division TM6 bacterium GW2011_GWF2_28_16]
MNTKLKQDTFWEKNLGKILIVFVYILLFAIFLYLPVIKNFFSEKNKILNVYAFTDMISPETAKEFEDLTGIKVNLKYFDTNEELYAKFKISQGKGYDLITTSDSTVELLINSDLLAKIDINKLLNFKNIDTRLTGLYFDPKNQFSIPYFWSTDGIIFNKNRFKNINVDWDLVFNKPKNNKFKICMLDSSKEAILLVAINLFNRVDNLTDQELEQIKKVLVNQSTWVDAYMLASLQYYLFSDVVPLAITSSAFAKKVLELSDDFEYTIPKNGTIILVDNLVIPKSSKKIELAHKFIDFLISKKIIAYNSDKFGYNPANKYAYELLPEKFVKNKAFFPDNNTFKKLYLLHNNLNVKKIDDLWLEVQLSKD